MRRAVPFVLMVTLWAGTATPQGAPRKNAETAQEPQARATPADPDVEAMRADLARMRNLVGQMQRNLGFVDSGLTPLKHQFELEIEMWNVLINDMQRRLNARLEPPTTKPSPRSQ